jgi:hypothetical protein
LIYVQQLRDAAQVRREVHDRADVQVAVGPTIKAMADSGRERVIDCGVAECALNAYRTQLAIAVKECSKADDRVQFQERQRDRRIVQIDLARLQLMNQR